LNQSSNGITAVVLAGGKATRMGGMDKGLVELAGRPMIEHVIKAVAPQVEMVLINANRSLETYAGYNLRVIPDTSNDYAGPLAGIAAGIEAAATDLILSVPCDGPWIPLDLVSRLRQKLEESTSDVCVAHDGERMQPVFALFRKQALPDIQSYLDAGDRKLQLWVRQQGAAIADFSDHPEAFINVNTPDEKDRVEKLLLKV